MARPRKKRRTQQPGQTALNARANGVSKAKSGERVPQSMVIRMGGSDVGSGVSQLVKDVREVMQPHTAASLRERRGNKLRDYATMAGPLGVSHFLLFSRSAAGNTSLRMAVTPRGPTLGFRIEKYSLAKDIVKSQRRPKAGSIGNEHLTPPLLVMNNFTTASATSSSSIPKHLEQLTTSVFQSLFPPISPQRTPLSSIKRVLLVNREPSASAEADGSYVLSLRHYAITAKPLVTLSRGIKRLIPVEKRTKRSARARLAHDSDGEMSDGPKKPRGSKGGFPDMSRWQDVADGVLDPSAAGYTSASDSEIDTDAEVEVLETDARRVMKKRERQAQQQAVATNGENGAIAKVAKASRTQKRAIKLTEIGPRMTLRLVKVEEGMCSGKVMWHEFYQKSEKEQNDLDAVWEQRRAEKEERRRIQKENVMRKKKENGKDEVLCAAFRQVVEAFLDQVFKADLLRYHASWAQGPIPHGCYHFLKVNGTVAQDRFDGALLEEHLSHWYRCILRPERDIDNGTVDSKRLDCGFDGAWESCTVKDSFCSIVVGDSVHHGDNVNLGGIVDKLRPELLDVFLPRGCNLRHDNVLHPFCNKRQVDGTPDGPPAQDQRRRRSIQLAGIAHGMPCDRQRLHQSANITPNAIRQLERHPLLDDQRLRHAAVALHAQEAPVLAAVDGAPDTRGARTVVQAGLHSDLVADVDARDALADLGHDTGEFVPEDDRQLQPRDGVHDARLDGNLLVEVDVQVAAADAGVLRRQLDLAWAAPWLGHVLDADVFVSIVGGGSHGGGHVASGWTWDCFGLLWKNDLIQFMLNFATTPVVRVYCACMPYHILGLLRTRGMDYSRRPCAAPSVGDLRSRKSI
ncbi:hypothetical protein FH972_021664 [Carpinus fangiana]|uniref:Brix domain-containing protein n=1 Tax=Carpinus fangiana TaxID=176857 RepID=A0A5N6KQK8_9ROSI|nr:hypothetical protein FH972_021664 [Carpinus fangiana]